MTVEFIEVLKGTKMRLKGTEMRLKGTKIRLKGTKMRLIKNFLSVFSASTCSSIFDVS